MSKDSLKKILKTLGPGLLYAGAAIGVSHLVQSTRAGAMYHFDLVWVLIIANLLKYPFFEFGPRYATATGTSLVDGYARIGKWAVILFALLTVLTMFIIQAAVTVVTAGLLAYIFNITINITLLSIIILLFSVAFLVSGKYSALDRAIKFIIVLLALSTIMAVFAALGIHHNISPGMIRHFKWTDAVDIFFLIAFVGWMPAPIDVSVWSSIWNLEKNKELGYTPRMKIALLDFNIGYVGTAVLALGFLSLGALVMYGSDESLPSTGVKFAEQLIHLYTYSIGQWSFWIISIAVLMTMFSTVITVLDAYARVLHPIVRLIFPDFWKRKINKEKLNWFWYVLIIAGASFFLIFAVRTMVQMVTMATTLSFLTAPVLAWLNYRVVTGPHMPAQYRPGMFLRILSWIGIIFFTVFSLLYIYWKYIV